MIVSSRDVNKRVCLCVFVHSGFYNKRAQREFFLTVLEVGSLTSYLHDWTLVRDLFQISDSQLLVFLHGRKGRVREPVGVLLIVISPLYEGSTLMN